jgi:hypothetical protein
MSQEKNNDNLHKLNAELPTIEIVEHPPELLELDEETVAIARAKFAGVDFDGIYGDEDRSSPELIVRTQARKIRELFQTAEELRDAFSSEHKRTQAIKDILIDGIDLQFVKTFCQMNQWDFSDDAGALALIAFECESSGGANG